ncbi:YueH family protein [Cytobacillus purgationiresistens]|uniref:YueH-like protein n=1 Tax=Cytobacillus purgationiresistens TaxID=863449 RepID=A0ABU0AA79_9BACI|nr:YueH family protein [Cytobacillus purgationiresistens]MDQ0268151.1 hypothetical protein [Cytobacillus purgationiresistens]
MLGTKNSDVFVIKTADHRYIVSIPDIHWSGQVNELDEFDQRVNHLIGSLTFHLYEGNSQELAHNLALLTVNNEM